MESYHESDWIEVNQLLSSHCEAENFVAKLIVVEFGLSLDMHKANEFYAKSIAIYAVYFKHEKLSALNQRRIIKDELSQLF